jgi:quercetin dioxygenase-like cupin family protein
MKEIRVIRTRFLVAVAAALLGVAALGGIVLATPASLVTSTTLATGSLDPINLNVKNGAWKAEIRTKGQTSLTVVENRVAPGGSFGWHSHPGPSLVIVKSGTLTFYLASDPTCSPTVHSAGEAYVDEGTDVHIARNEGTTEAVVIVTRLIPEGSAPRIDQPDPGTCPF